MHQNSTHSCPRKVKVFIKLHNTCLVRTFLRFYRHFETHCSKTSLKKSDLPLLSKCRDCASLCHLYKILHHLSSSPNPYPHPRPSLHNLNSHAIVPPFGHLTFCQKSFYPYAPTLWNYLREDIIQCNSLQSFNKSVLHAHLG